MATQQRRWTKKDGVLVPLVGITTPLPPIDGDVLTRGQRLWTRQGNEWDERTEDWVIKTALDPSAGFSGTYELGWEFRTNRILTVRAIRIWTPNAQTNKVISLWSASEALIASWTLPETLANEWTEYELPTPVTLQSATNYTLSQTTTNDLYRTISISSLITDPRVHYVAGRFNDSAGQYPSSTIDTTIYGAVDILVDAEDEFILDLPANTYAHWNANATQGRVDTWPDDINGYLLTPRNSGQFAFAEERKSGNRVVLFDGVQYLGDNPVKAQPLTIVFAASIQSDDSFKLLFDGTDVDRIAFGWPSTSPQTGIWAGGLGGPVIDGGFRWPFAIWTLVVNGASSSLWLNHRQIGATGNPGSRALGALNLGGHNNNNATSRPTARIGDFILIERAITPAERIDLVDQLLRKHGIL